MNHRMPKRLRKNRRRARFQSGLRAITRYIPRPFVTALAIVLLFALVRGTAASWSPVWGAVESNTTAHTLYLVRDIRAGVEGSAPINLTALNDTLLFGADDGSSGIIVG